MDCQNTIFQLLFVEIPGELWAEAAAQFLEQNNSNMVDFGVAKGVPIFEGSEDTYQADTCVPLTRAVEAGEIRLESCVHGHYPGRKLPRGTLSRVKSVGFWDATHDQAWGLAEHHNEGIELTFLETGGLGFAVNNTEFQLEADDLTITRPWQQHRVGLPNVTAGRLHWLILDVGVRRPDQPWHWPSWSVLAKDDLDELTQILRHNEHPVWHSTVDVRRCFQRIAKTIESYDTATARGVSRLTVQLNDLLLCVLEMLREHSIVLDETLSETKRSVSLFLNDLAQNTPLLRREWTVREMATSCGLGVTQFIHYCRLITNMTPVKYLNQCRLDAAKQILQRQPESTITAIAAECGFSSSQYFATAFHRQFGMSPTAYLKSTAKKDLSG
jgi:AraC family L-rhamnose operon regulatory protein RhaS